MDVLAKARELGAALQASEEYVRYAKARLNNDNNKELQDAIGEFNLIRLKLDQEISKDENKDDLAIRALNEQLREKYNQVMANSAMAEYNEAKKAVDKILNDINSIIMMCAEGEDPATCEIPDCTGDCSTCGGCH